MKNEDEEITPRIKVFTEEEKARIIKIADKVLDALDELPELEDRVFAILAVMEAYTRSDGVDWKTAGLMRREGVGK